MAIWLSVLDKENLEEFLSKLCNYLNKMKSWALSHQSLSLVILLTFSVEHLNQISIGSTQPLLLQNLETHAIIKELTTLFSPTIFLTFLQQLQLTKLEFGMLKIDNNFWEFKSQVLNVSVYFLCMMESLSFQVGAMVR